jgi:transcriptional regulator with XRE-family HTH domain
MTSFADVLQTAMDREGISASDLAGRSGLTESAISLLRAGRRAPSFRSIQALSKALPPLGAMLAEQPIEDSVFDAIEDAIADIRDGKMVIVLDDEDRENEGDLVMAAEMVTPEAINFMRKEAGGLICVPLIGKRLDELQIRRWSPTTRRRSAPRSPCRSKRATARHDRDLGARSFQHDPGAARSGRRRRATSCGPATRFRCARATAACSCAPVKPKRRSISRASPDSIRPA